MLGEEKDRGPTKWGAGRRRSLRCPESSGPARRLQNAARELGAVSSTILGLRGRAKHASS